MDISVLKANQSSCSLRNMINSRAKISSRDQKVHGLGLAEHEQPQSFMASPFNIVIVCHVANLDEA